MGLINNFSTNDKNKRTRNKKLLIVIRILFVISLVLGYIIIIKNGIRLNDHIEDLLFKTENASIWIVGGLLIASCVFFVLVVVFWGIFTLCMYYRFSLRVYGLSKKTELWIIDFEKETVIKAQVVSITKGYNGCEFDSANFDCIIWKNGKKHNGHLPGQDIYFSERDAINVLNYIKEVNDNVLKQYYPNWEQDDDFVLYYRECQFNRPPQRDRGIGNVTDISVYTLAPVIINEIKYEPIPIFDHSGRGVQELMKYYIKRTEEKIKYKKEKQDIINQMSELRNKKELQ